jgi:6-bladed beta-propeller
MGHTPRLWPRAALMGHAPREEMKMNTNLKPIMYVLLILLFLSAGFLNAGVVENRDKPAKGDYIFPMEKVWQVDSANKTPFANLIEIPIADSGHVFCRDLKNKENYLFDKNGKYICTFGTQGEGPGEVKSPGGANLAVIGNTVIIRDSNQFLYFDNTGKFLRSVVNNAIVRRAALFLSLDEFISAPTNITAVSNDTAKMMYVNLKTGKEKVITDFSVFKGGIIQDGNSRVTAVIRTITPVMVVGQLHKKLYYGLNDKYRIYVTDLEGNDLGGFKLKREQVRVTLKEKEDFMLSLVKGLAPDEIARQLAKTLPEEETYFRNIEPHNGLLYVFKSHFVPTNHQQIDIFTPKGKYLYRGLIKVEDGFLIKAGPTLKGNTITLVLEDEEGEISLNKYKTIMPH